MRSRSGIAGPPGAASSPAAKPAGIEGVSFYDMRHAFASRIGRDHREAVHPPVR